MYAMDELDQRELEELHRLFDSQDQKDFAVLMKDGAKIANKTLSNNNNFTKN